jgi:hypothetical protein
VPLEERDVLERLVLVDAPPPFALGANEVALGGAGLLGDVVGLEDLEEDVGVRLVAGVYLELLAEQVIGPGVGDALGERVDFVGAVLVLPVGDLGEGVAVGLEERAPGGDLGVGLGLTFRRPLAAVDDALEEELDGVQHEREARRGGGRRRRCTIRTSLRW